MPVPPGPLTRRDRVASRVLAILFVAGAVGLAVSSLTGGVMPAPLLMLTGLAFVALAAGWYLALRRRTVAGVLLAVAGMEGVLWLMFWQGGATDDATLFYLTVPVLVAGLLLPPAWALGTALGSLAVAVVLDPLLDRATGHPALVTADLNLATLLGLISAVGVTAAWILDGVVQTLEHQTEALAVATQQLQSAATERQRMFQQVAHDLATPLTPIALQVGILRRQGADERAIAIVQRNVGHLQKQVEDLKDLARVEGGGLRLVRVSCDVDQLVREAAESFQDAGRLKGVAVTVALPGSLRANVDRERVNQVLFNLLSNAVKFTPAGGSVMLSIRQDGDWVMVAVQDSGRGLSSEEVDRLFRPFAQVHRPDESTERGTGLGLYVSRGIAQAHGGELQVKSDGLGKGSTFVLKLPAG